MILQTVSSIACFLLGFWYGRAQVTVQNRKPDYQHIEQMEKELGWDE